MIITSRKLLCLHNDTPPVHHGAVVFRGETIVATGPAEKILKKHPGHLVYRLENAVLLPGLINVHTHLELPPLLDATRSKRFPEWVMNLIQAKKAIDIREYESASNRNVKALLECGTTTVGEICTHGVSPDILKQSGLRAVVYQEIISMNPTSPVPHLSSLVSRSPSSVEKITALHARG
jgi:cytosine/adenosine deaminase-related metal-dependent hydrolase